MATETPAPDEVLKQLQAVIDEAGPLRRQRRRRYDPGHVFDLELTGVCPAHRARARMVVEKFIGGGFAGQVYRARLEDLEQLDGQVAGLEVGRAYALKLLLPPSGSARRFRNLLYGLAYQGHFSAQVHPAAARTGVLWQTLIGRAAEIEFDRPEVVRRIHATFYDDGLGAFGEIGDWVDGRQWKFELDERLFDRRPADPADARPDFAATGAPEYFAKKHFMARFVRLLHRVGAPELARQYEWWTCKSQPNVLKRLDLGDGPDGDAVRASGPAEGLCAIDFRAGLALLPFLPMSPGDVKLIWAGLKRGALVQFDRGDLSKLEAYVDEHAAKFQDLRPALEELKQADPTYRASLADITHHGPQPLWNRALRQSIIDGIVRGWRAKHIVDDAHAETFRKRRLQFLAFLLLGFIPWLGNAIRRRWGDLAYRRHVGMMLRSWSYLCRAVRARQAEILMDWRRRQRRSPEAILALAYNPWFWVQRFAFGWLVPAWHRFLLEPAYAWDVLRRYVGGLFLFLKDADFRQKWLDDLIEAGYRQGELSEKERDQLRAHAADPYIRTFLLCLAGHLACTPVTHIVNLIVVIYYIHHNHLTWTEGLAAAGWITALFQSTPISPGSLARGLFVVGVMIAKQNFRDFRVAAAVSFWKYIGYLGFPIQMVAKYPTLARFLAGRWARQVVHHVPVFGEHGALLEHTVLDLFFNKPVSIRRRIAEGKETALRLVGKMILAAEWLAFSVVAALLAWQVRSAEQPTAHHLWHAMLPAIGAMFCLFVWMAYAPRFAWVRRLWWLWLALAALPAGIAAATHRALLLPS